MADRGRDVNIVALGFWRREVWDLGKSSPEWEIALKGRDRTLAKDEINELLERRAVVDRFHASEQGENKNVLAT